MTNSETPSPPVALEDRGRHGDGRQFSPSAARNGGPIREVLERVLPRSGLALEIGSGILLMGVGFLLFTNQLAWFNSHFAFLADLVVGAEEWLQ